MQEHEASQRPNRGTARRRQAHQSKPMDATPKFPGWSGRRDSNPRRPAWKAGTLPTELLPHEPPSRTAMACDGDCTISPRKRVDFAVSLRLARRAYYHDADGVGSITRTCGMQ